MYADNGGDEKTLTYYVREYIPPEYVLGSCETGGDGNNSVFVISIEKVKAILEKELEGEINYEKKESKISTKKKRWKRNSSWNNSLRSWSMLPDMENIQKIMLLKNRELIR